MDLAMTGDWLLQGRRPIWVATTAFSITLQWNEGKQPKSVMFSNHATKHPAASTISLASSRISGKAIEAIPKTLMFIRYIISWIEDS